jgi:hypothetical protein
MVRSTYVVISGFIIDMKEYNLKELVKGGKKVNFVRYRKNELIYATECGLEFPVPIDDAGDGVFLAQDAAIYFMRYIRKHLESMKDIA